MRRPFNGSYPQSQGFGGNASAYAQFGLKGHNGIDFALPTGTPLLAAISGKVVEVTNDPTGYGLYVKIESATEGALTAHMQKFNVSLGQDVKEGDLIGYSDNTGNSTGPHLHFGYYKIPRDRQNGYSGYIDPTSYFNVTNSTPTMDPKIQAKASGFDRVWSPFNHNGKTTENSTEADHLSFVSWIKSQRERAGKWDQICNLAFQGVVDSNKITPDQLYTQLTSSSFNKLKFLEEIKKLLQV